MTLSIFVSLFVVHIEALGQRFKVILRVNKVLNRQLGKSEQLAEVSVAHSFEIVTVEASIRDVLEQGLKLAQVDLFGHLIQIGVDECAPVDSALAVLKFKFGRQGHQVR